MPAQRIPTGDAFDSTPGTLINGRFRVESEAGRGNFARVLRAKDTKTDRMVAVKILRAAYARDAKFENEVLRVVGQKDPHDVHRVCKSYDHFHWGGCPCFIFPLLGVPLKSRQHHFGVASGRCSRDDVRLLALQLGRALRFLHFECRLVHTDLKPENILVTNPDRPHGLGGGWTIADFGSASFYTERPDKDLISTRPYRGPEILLQAGWGYAADTWSLACILYEVYCGRLLFSTSQDAHHLQLMEWRLGSCPQWLIDQASSEARRMFDSSGRLRPPSHAGARPASLATELSADAEFCDLMLRLLDYDPAVRIRADEACLHPFCAKADRESDSLLTKLPPSAYSAQRIRSPGCALLAAGAPRPSPERLLSRNSPAAPPPQRDSDRRLSASRRPSSAASSSSQSPSQPQRTDSVSYSQLHSSFAQRLAPAAPPPASLTPPYSRAVRPEAVLPGAERWPSRCTAPRRPTLSPSLLGGSMLGSSLSGLGGPSLGHRPTADRRVSPDGYASVVSERAHGGISPSRLPLSPHSALPQYSAHARGPATFSQHADPAASVRVASWRDDLHRRQL
eukprot:TRINITY_DN940_c0_g1_i2.p1 TRINITY_DN940_c0_g1~~TRINITY_DN940_c0_g1_i2.p1  ORF type:complete len:595 (+),score=129.73 TRINITY_DN940_c0_g1_i2:90-1787(+)